MTSQARSNPRRRPDPPPFLGQTLDFGEIRNGVRHVERPSWSARQKLMATLLGQANEARTHVPGLVNRMRSLLRDSDPLFLYSRVAFLLQMRRIAPGPATFGADALVEFLGGLVTAMPVDDVLSRLGQDDHPQTLYTMEALLREYGVGQRRISDAEALRPGERSQLARAVRLLEAENLFDRMNGYPAQLETIFTTIVAPLAERSRSTLGFALGDALTVANAYQDILDEGRRQVVDEFQVLLDRIPPNADHDTLIQTFATHMAGVATIGASPVVNLTDWLVERTGFPAAEVSAILDSMSTRLGSQPDLDSLASPNTLRRRPIVGLPDGRHLWITPGDFLHTALEWAADVCDPHPTLRKTLDKRRQDGCEELAYLALRGVFGDDHAHAAVTYPADGQRPDIDVLVATPGGTIIVEAKAARFTDPARRAAPERVRKKTREYVDKALDQNARTIAYLHTGAQDLRDARKRRMTIPNSPHITSVIVTLDRVDPFATYLPDGGKRQNVPPEGTWLVNLADLLMTTDILRHPAEFYAYANLRASINHVGGPLIFVETDALGLWCEERITPIPHHAGALATFGQTSALMNDYYTHPHNIEEPSTQRPTSGVPLEVLAALDDVLRTRADRWHPLAAAALSVQPQRWAAVRKALRTVSPTRTSRRAKKNANRAKGGLNLAGDLTIIIDNTDTKCNDCSNHLHLLPQVVESETGEDT
ncbi:nuclease-related domain-containing protein [Actinokineospora globicatena]|uniref:Nuclease-related domain-containing protein n=1 Tax=Actinokineospora globicatena TaxID=103729 RepID=A0A9W6V8N6_9PSEU|nr:nuclease-related domain-containing protein [Actinokineospora globicatena]GLW90156.1 hypothetical protein Aglo03_09720 [Actinokineospora globicatena]